MTNALRLFALLLAVLLVSAVPAAAQTAYGIPNQGILQYTTASVSCSNSQSACALWSSTIPGAYMATSPNTNSVYSPSFVVGPVPLHLQLQGQLTTNVSAAGVGTINLGVNYGGGVTGVASFALANAYLPPENLQGRPFQIDVWVSSVATATGTALPGAGPCYVYLSGTMKIATSASTGVAGAYPVILDNHICGTTGGAFLASAEQLNVIMNWASASLTNSLNVYRGTLQLGM